ncbi:glycosyltransferase [Chryseobacterium koreense]|uniref:glycosyltransferase family 2 protein n=1 Tax=Chryseobacterium koreense TaxID=232216 RepID=UPI0026EDE5B6|nr:glycosyltransferase [Chryseobacterium koreense]
MKVTVIIPVYNAEKYLDECIQSVLDQNFTDFELLLINDGSSDNSAMICDRYAYQNRRVKVFHKKNGGVSSARNLGIENAKGEWITFIDSDDYISGNYFTVLGRDANIDLILQGLIYVQDGNILNETLYDSEKIDSERFLLKYNVYPYYSSSCSKFFKRSILQKHKISFDPEISFGEDTLFNLKYLRSCSEILTANTPGYRYRVSDGGLSASVSDFKHDLRFYTELKEQLEKYDNKEIHDKSIVVALTRLSKSIFNDRKLRLVERRKILKEVVESNYHVFLQIYTNPKIKVFFIIAHYTGFYSMLDFALSKINNK